MTAKEKARELISKYTFLSYPESDAKFYNPKQCALIAVDEIIQSQKCCNECKYEGSIEMKFWQQVKQEITNL